MSIDEFLIDAVLVSDSFAILGPSEGKVEKPDLQFDAIESFVSTSAALFVYQQLRGCNASRPIGNQERSVHSL